MISKHEILAKINEAVKTESGSTVDLNSTFLDAQLDSLGSIMVIATIDSEFPILGDGDTGTAMKDLDLKNLTIRDLVTKCLLSIINTSTEQKTGETT